LSGYSKYLLILQRISSPSASDTLNMVFGTGSGPTYISSSYNWSLQNMGISSSSNSGQASVGSMSIAGLSSYGGTAGLSGFINIEGMNSGSYPTINFLTFFNPSFFPTAIVGGGNQDGNNSEKTAIRIAMNGGSIYGTASLYGISS